MIIGPKCGKHTTDITVTASDYNALMRGHRNGSLSGLGITPQTQLQHYSTSSTDLSNDSELASDGPICHQWVACN